jgi:hypothetical protein
MRVSSRFSALFVCAVVALVGAAAPAFADDSDSILKQLKNINTIASTVPGNGDVNPYGIVEVKTSTGNLQQGHILISNFNNMGNLQGTGTTIVDVAPNGSLTTFAQMDASSLPGPCPGGVGLTTALAVLRTGWVIVGSLPTSDGTSATAQAGCLLVLNSSGTVVETFYGSLINGPWDMTWSESGHEAHLCVTNFQNGTLSAAGKVSPLPAIDDEGSRYRRDVVRLTTGGFQTMTQTISVGAGDRGRHCFGMVGQTVVSGFDRIV